MYRGSAILPSLFTERELECNPFPTWPKHSAVFDQQIPHIDLCIYLRKLTGPK